MFERFLFVEEAQSNWMKHRLCNDNIFNCSVGGDRICNILFRLSEKRILDAVTSASTVRQIVLMGGANDLERSNIDEILDGMEQIINIVHERCPHAHIDVCGVYPRASESVPQVMVLSNVAVEVFCCPSLLL